MSECAQDLEEEGRRTLPRLLSSILIKKEEEARLYNPCNLGPMKDALEHS